MMQKFFFDKRIRDYNPGDFFSVPFDSKKLKEYWKSQIEKGIPEKGIRPPNGENIWVFIKRSKS